MLLYKLHAWLLVKQASLKEGKKQQSNWIKTNARPFVSIMTEISAYGLLDFWPW